MSIHRLMDNLLCIQHRILGIKSNEALIHETTQMNLKTLLSESELSLPHIL